MPDDYDFQPFSETRAREIYRGTPALQAEFLDEERYLAFMRAESAGRIQLLSSDRDSAQLAVAEIHDTNARLHQQWQDSSQLQSTYPTAEDFIANVNERIDRAGRR